MIDRETKSNVFGKDQYRCVKCGESSNLTIDHIIPVIEGGTDEFKNLQTLCIACNYRKGGNLELSLWQKIKFIWNIDIRLQSSRANLGSEFRSALKEKANEKMMESRFKDANKVFIKLEKEINDSRNTLNGTMTNDRKQNAIKFLEIERKRSEGEYQMSEVERAFIELIDFLEVEYTPNGFRNKEN